MFFVLPRAPFGGMAERAPVALAQCVAVPDALDSVTAAAVGNPGMSAWAALKERARFATGETVLINGATGAAGGVAARIAKYRGAARVVVTGRNPEALGKLMEAGADATIPLNQADESLQAAFEREFARGVDVVLDYLWGHSALLALIAAARAGKEAVPIRYVQIGAMSGSSVELPAAVLRSSSLVLMGSGIGSVPLDRLVAVIGEVMEMAVPARLSVEAEAVPLSEIEQAWTRDADRKRLVFVPAGHNRAV
jgi:NADPH:quinone reductase-like Zn-dependent oxidoreductase